MRQLVDPGLKWKSSEGLGHIKFIFPSAWVNKLLPQHYSNQNRQLNEFQFRRPRMSVTGNGGMIMPSWFVWFFLSSISMHKYFFFFLGLTAIHLTFRIAQKTKKGCIGLSTGLINSFPSRKPNTISLLIELSLEVWVKAELYPSLQQSQSRNLLQAYLHWALISPFEEKLQRLVFFLVSLLLS